MILFPLESKTYALQEVESCGEQVLGKCEMAINKDKAKFLAKNCKGHKTQAGEDKEKIMESLISCK